ncbi:MAG: hypothetical protein K2O70_07970 [Desulfovibrionaceae bacterium]|nr:hypothetical protein [Desulfovibrionaceae bacterium]
MKVSPLFGASADRFRRRGMETDRGFSLPREGIVQNMADKVPRRSRARIRIRLSAGMASPPAALPFIRDNHAVRLKNLHPQAYRGTASNHDAQAAPMQGVVT